MSSYLSIRPFTPQNRLFFQLAAGFRATPLVASPSIHRPQRPRPRHIDSTVPRTTHASRTTERKRRAGHHNTKRFSSNSPRHPHLNSPSHRPHFRHINSIQFNSPQDCPCHRTTERKCRAGHHNTKRPGRNTTTPRRYNATTRHCDNTTCSHRASGTHRSTPQRCAASTPLYYATCIFHWRRGLYILFSSYSLYILYMF